MPAPKTQDIVAKLWNLCNILKDDGVTYHQYVNELTYLLFLKMARETSADGSGAEREIPSGYRWADLAGLEGAALMERYRLLLVHLGSHGGPRVRAIYQNASTSIRQPRHLHKLVTDINALDWYSAREEGLGDLYEGLLEKNATETKSGAGQYFTPRPLIESIVAVMQPRAGEIIQDPACGTIGFLVAADRHVKERTDDLFDLSTEQQKFQRDTAFQGMELVPDTHRLALMNGLLHDIHGPILLGDTLSNEGKHLANADLVLSNPPFGTKKGGGLPSRDDFTFPTSNKQLAFLQHIYRSLRKPSAKQKHGGRAAVVMPDNVLFEDNTGAQIRRDLMDKCRLHTLLRLPTGIFYAQGVKTNVLFFERHNADTGGTRDVWVYDLRANMPAFGKRTPLTREHFAEFEAAFGDDARGLALRRDTGETGRFRRFTREQIRARGENLDLTWLKDDNATRHDNLPAPEVLVASALEKLRDAVDELRTLEEELAK
ncbi:MAG: type I restriction-modification system subunit M [Opitutaceae bacterium]|jgi:type I restriction enzyme M protein|nr:type I restriction-modification system subunit M [Opitutaceae bacterium]